MFIVKTIENDYSDSPEDVRIYFAKTEEEAQKMAEICNGTYEEFDPNNIEFSEIYEKWTCTLSICGTYDIVRTEVLNPAFIERNPNFLIAPNGQILNTQTTFSCSTNEECVDKAISILSELKKFTIINIREYFRGVADLAIGLPLFITQEYVDNNNGVIVCGYHMLHFYNKTIKYIPPRYPIPMPTGNPGEINY
jgi:hypothetical protein